MGRPSQSTVMMAGTPMTEVMSASPVSMMSSMNLVTKCLTIRSIRSMAAGAVIGLMSLRHLRNSGGSISIGMWNGAGVLGMTTESPSPP